MEMIPVPVVGSARRTYGKGPQQSGGRLGVGRFFMGVRGAAAAASQARPLENAKGRKALLTLGPIEVPTRTIGPLDVNNVHRPTASR